MRQGDTHKERRRERAREKKNANSREIKQEQEGAKMCA